MIQLAGRARAADVALVLGGGNALGAYHAGACEVLFARGVEPGRIVGASVGALTGAILAGNPKERRLERLHEFWRQAAEPDLGLPGWAPKRARERHNLLHALSALALGRPGLFRQRFPGLWSVLPGLPKDRALLDHGPLARTLERLVDFDRLNGGEVRVELVCVDLETGEEVWFDNREDRLGPEHLLATTAMAPLFPPVELGGRLLADPGYVNNLPLERLFSELLERDLLVFAVELYSLRHGRPRGLDAVLSRVQDILFASHARRAVDFLRRELALRRQLDPGSPAATVVHLAHRAPDHDPAAKALDFSSASIRERISAGRRDAERALALLAARTPARVPFLHLAVEPAPEAGAKAARIAGPEAKDGAGATRAAGRNPCP